MQAIVKVALIAKPYRKILAISSVLIVLTAGVQLATPLVTKQIVDQIQLQIVDHSGNYTVLIQLLAIVFGLNAFNVLFQGISDRLGDAVSARITRYLINLFYDHILRLPQSYFDSEMSNKIMNQLTRGINSIGEFIGASTNFIIPSLIQSVFCIGLLAYYSIPIGILASIIFPIYVWISNYSTTKWGGIESQKNDIEDKYKNRIAEVIQNMKLVKTVNSQGKEKNYVKTIIGNYVNLYDGQSTTYHILNIARNAVLEIVLIIIIIITFRNTFVGTISIGEMVLIMQLLNQLRRPLFGMSYMLERIQRANAGAKEFFSILELPAAEMEQHKPTQTVSKHPTVTLKNIAFKYETSAILKNLSTSFTPGENVALIGPSGAGKTTLVNILLALYSPTSGSIMLDNSDYKVLNFAQIRSNFAYVFQDNELFSESIWHNVTYGNNEATEAEVTKALKAAYAYDFVKELPNGWHTMIGERGVKLSGGQKQRIQIARALLSKAPILILDEATSSLDAKSEALIQQALLNVTKEKTVIIIAHRFSTLQHVDRILVLDKGTIVDEGAPQVLAKRKGIFQELLQYQIEGNQKLLQKYDMVS
jgi:ATP-binding cassette subfamily B protein